MTSGTKVWNIITGLVMIAAGAWLFYDPAHGLKAVAIVLSISCTLRGFQIIFYYLTMVLLAFCTDLLHNESISNW